MKRLLMTLTLLALVGCGGVITNAKYSELIDKTAVVTSQAASRAVAGTLTESQKTEALQLSADSWQLIRAAKNGTVK